MAKIRPAGMSDEDCSDSEEDYDISKDFGFKLKVKSKKKKRKTKLCAVQFQHNPGLTLSNPGRCIGILPKKIKKLSFWEKKALAFEKFGEADIRPQNKYRHFLLHRRQLNNGKWDNLWTLPQNRQHAEPFPRELLSNLEVKLLPQLYQNSFEVINTDEGFDSMIMDLKNQSEISIDLEANDDHSYLGMTVLIQIGTLDKDYIIDCFPVTNKILTDLKLILEDPVILKYVYGGDNDILWLKRDFLIQITSLLDVQILIQLLVRDGKLDEIMKLLPMNQKKIWYHRYIRLRTNNTSNEQKRAWEIKACETTWSFEMMVELFYPEQDIQKVAQVADFRPREPSNSQYAQLLKYARDDVHILFHIMKILKTSVPYQKTFDSAVIMTNQKLNKMYKRKVYASHTVAMESLKEKFTCSKQIDKFQIVYDWRNHHSIIIDENPDIMFTVKQLSDLIKYLPASQTDMVSRMARQITKVNQPPECIKTFEKTLYHLITSGKEYYDKIMSIQCHNCRLVKGHAGWGCPNPWSMESTKLNLKENDSARSNQNRRRRQNKRENKRLQKMQ